MEIDVLCHVIVASVMNAILKAEAASPIRHAPPAEWVRAVTQVGYEELDIIDGVEF